MQPRDRMYKLDVAQRGNFPNPEEDKMHNFSPSTCHPYKEVPQSLRVHIPAVKTILSDAVSSAVFSEGDRRRSISRMTRVARS